MSPGLSKNSKIPVENSDRNFHKNVRRYEKMSDDIMLKTMSLKSFHLNLSILSLSVGSSRFFSNILMLIIIITVY